MSLQCKQILYHKLTPPLFVYLREKKNFKDLLFVCMNMKCMHCPERPEGGGGTQALELPYFVNNLIQVVGTGPRSSARAAGTLKPLNSFPAQLFLIIKLF